MAQDRQKNRRLYFNELAETSNKYFVPYISQFKEIKRHMNILEVGCGDGGNLLMDDFLFVSAYLCYHSVLQS